MGEGDSQHVMHYSLHQLELSLLIDDFFSLSQLCNVPVGCNLMAYTLTNKACCNPDDHFMM